MYVTHPTLVPRSLTLSRREIVDALKAAGAKGTFFVSALIPFTFI
jgi:hypothetical protein